MKGLVRVVGDRVRLVGLTLCMTAGMVTGGCATVSLAPGSAQAGLGGHGVHGATTPLAQLDESFVQALVAGRLRDEDTPDNGVRAAWRTLMEGASGARSDAESDPVGFYLGNAEISAGDQAVRIITDAQTLTAIVLDVNAACARIVQQRVVEDDNWRMGEVAHAEHVLTLGLKARGVLAQALDQLSADIDAVQLRQAGDALSALSDSLTILGARADDLAALPVPMPMVG